MMPLSISSFFTWYEIVIKQKMAVVKSIFYWRIDFTFVVYFKKHMCVKFETYCQMIKPSEHVQGGHSFVCFTTSNRFWVKSSHYWIYMFYWRIWNYNRDNRVCKKLMHFTAMQGIITKQKIANCPFSHWRNRCSFPNRKLKTYLNTLPSLTE